MISNSQIKVAVEKTAIGGSLHIPSIFPSAEKALTAAEEKIGEKSIVMQRVNN